MKSSQAQEAFAALSQETRLAIFRFLIRQSARALSAGQIAEKVKVPPSTFSFHAAALERAGLVKSQRLQRQIFYSADLHGVRALVTFLLQDCCGGRPEICADLFPGLKGSECDEPEVEQRTKRRAR